MGIKSAAPGKLFDGGGLFLDVRENGSRYWRLKYRFAGKERLLAFGVYPEVSLSEARSRRDAARAALRDGRDPGAIKRAHKVASKVAAANSFEAVGLEWLAKQKPKMAPATHAKAEWMLQRIPLDRCASDRRD
ncbi:MAG TPA: Arm DNA-binding domain-containing protein [Lysobacter sp.]